MWRSFDFFPTNLGKPLIEACHMHRSTHPCFASVVDSCHCSMAKSTRINFLELVLNFSCLMHFGITLGVTHHLCPCGTIKLSFINNKSFIMTLCRLSLQVNCPQTDHMELFSELPLKLSTVSCPIKLSVIGATKLNKLHKIVFSVYILKCM